ncbi:type VI secretion system baseplate subunit TssF [Photorhabdus noenieputensis]|uniref:type VI secretion system baseplate subunit TssF n=1 Tax=Photorhabdus noenieputensis TaxID=1208607 RepID=UPI001BD5C711|nr:type VI secretion system baseplate subunit TssF [Photorhabdus noenieputensis]MBS9438207.1 type VI secretion system baseplate subunit TssF [Photorhabdus noenieputensis]MCK3668956.1 type VI secretion system baseplate subunit TssF [Photorhabdus noenieputensis]
MDDLILRYYEAEMHYLREAGKEFAQAHPDRAAMLNLSDDRDLDPYVERLLEGFAFLMGRMRQKLDDDLPELTEGLVSLLWPHYLRTIPSLSIVELAPDYQTLPKSEVIAKGFEVISQPVGPSQTRCYYRTTRDVQITPLHITSATLQNEADGRSVIRLRFDCGQLTEWDKVDLARLPLYLKAGRPVSSALHLALTRQTQHIYTRLPSQEERSHLENGSFSPMGFDNDDVLWPKQESAFSGYQLLLEYFTFREKFMFVALNGLDSLEIPTGTPWFELDIVLSELWPYELKFSAENIRLHCVPVINLFRVEADPMHISRLQNEYLLCPMRIQDGHTEIYSVDEVSSSRRGDAQRFVPFSSFRHRGGIMRSSAPERYFHTRVCRGPSGLHDTWLILGGESFETDPEIDDETLSLRITGTNGQLPRQALRNTQLEQTLHSAAGTLRVSNLCSPTLPCYPPANDRFHWRILSHLGSSFLSMMDNPEVLRGTLGLYNWTNDEMNCRCLDAIVGVKHALIERFEKGFLLRGVDIEITLNSNGFSGEGDIFLFGELLNRFFSLYTDIHLFNQLTLILQPSGRCLRWQENHNQRIPG